MFFALSMTERDRVAELYRRAGHSALRRAKQILRSDSEAEDVVHEIFTRIAESPDDLNRAENPLAWLYGATTHACLNRIRNQKNRVRLLKENHSPDVHTGMSADTKTTIENVLRALPQDEATMFVYYHLDQMTHAEIADALGCSRRHVGNVLERAESSLRTMDMEGVTP